MLHCRNLLVFLLVSAKRFREKYQDIAVFFNAFESSSGTILLGMAGCAVCLFFLTTGLAAADDLRPLCPDRPGKGTSPCTLDEGHFQLEIDAFDATLQRSGGVTTDIYVVGNPTFKYGLSQTVDIEASFAPYIYQHTRSVGSIATIDGHGDLYFRGKWNFLGNDGSFAAVVEPFVKIPTATHGLGDGALEEGLVLPLSYDLGNGWSLASTPEVDLLLNTSGSGRHANAVDVIGLGRAFENGITLGAEFWTSQDFDPSRTTAQYSFDLDVAWQPLQDSNLQLDGGINIGLNSKTPDTQMYVGISRRF